MIAFINKIFNQVNRRKLLIFMKINKYYLYLKPLNVTSFSAASTTKHFYIAGPLLHSLLQFISYIY